MDREAILNVFRDLAHSQGFYGRLLASIEEARECNPDVYEAFMEELEAQKFGDAVDLILYIEC